MQWKKVHSICVLLLNKLITNYLITKITNSDSGATCSSSSRDLDSMSTSAQWQSGCCNLQSEPLNLVLVNSVSPIPSPLPWWWLGSTVVWSKDDKQQLAGTGGRVNGQAINCENRSAHVATIRALFCTLFFYIIFVQLLVCHYYWCSNAVFWISAHCLAGLLEQPYILEEGQKREKKKVQRLEVTPPVPSKPKRLSLEEGSGTKLGDIPRIEQQLQKTHFAELKPLYKLLFVRLASVSCSCQLWCLLYTG